MKFYLEKPTIERKKDAIDYISEFSQYIQSVIGTSDDVITELQKVIE